MRPLVRRLFDLCAKYDVPMFSEGVSNRQAQEWQRASPGLKADEAF